MSSTREQHMAQLRAIEQGHREIDAIVDAGWYPYLFSPQEIEEMELDFERDQRQMSYDWPLEPEYTDVWAQM